MIIETLTTKCLNRIAKTKKDASIRGRLFVGFAMGICFFAPGSKGIPGFIVETAAISILLFLGMCLIVRGSVTKEKTRKT